MYCLYCRIITPVVEEFWQEATSQGDGLSWWENLIRHQPGASLATGCRHPTVAVTDFCCSLKRWTSDSHAFQWAGQPPYIAPSPSGIWISSNMFFLGPTWVSLPNGILIGSAVFLGLTRVTYRPTNHATLSIAIACYRYNVAYDVEISVLLL